ncbi:GNAT family protein (plasmid) [Photobacterium sp. DA100]|uniref:GNAT family N-acetyltransferase n=1 Tax=Photobacterium sp. DA100 TaxID=3027472 RepID=UPI0024795ECB|nr:GNAT family protein [Photobacterium sp. DA100]WEM44213.1 GNAT family protein [Photobacterium sp. DA100]
MYFNQLQQPIGTPMPDWQGASIPEPVTLSGHFTRLEPLSPNLHGNDLFAAFSADHENRMWTYMFMGPFDNKESFFDWLTPLEHSRDPLFFAIIDPTTGQAVGIASYMRIVPQMGVIEIGNFLFSSKLQKTPAATEAIHLMLKHAFETLGYRRCEWKCDSLNHPSRRAAERLGFIYEGLFRQAIVYNGRNRDTTWYAIIDRDWPTVERAHQAWLSADNFDENGQQKVRLAELLDMGIA